MKSLLITVAAAAALAALAGAATKNNQSTSVTVNGKTITIKYASPAVNGREGKIFGTDGLIGHDPTYPVWRAGANSATALHTDADLTIGSLSVPKGDYTLFVDVADPANWKLVVSKATGEWGLAYNASNDLGRTPMTMSKPPAMVEQLKWTLSSSGNGGKMTLAWENHEGSVTFTAK